MLFLIKFVDELMKRTYKEDEKRRAKRIITSLRIMLGYDKPKSDSDEE